MNFLSGVYNGLINTIADEKTSAQYKTNKGRESIYECDRCTTSCNANCICRCHVMSCNECDTKNCDVNRCRCECHIDDYVEPQRVNVNVANNGHKRSVSSTVYMETTMNGNRSSYQFGNNENTGRMGLNFNAQFNENVSNKPGSFIKMSNDNYVPNYTNPGNQNMNNLQNPPINNPNVQVNQNKPANQEEPISATKRFAMKFAASRKSKINAGEGLNTGALFGPLAGDGHRRSVSQSDIQNVNLSTPNKNEQANNDYMEYIKKLEVRTEREKELNKSDNNQGKKKLFSKYSPIVFKDQYTEEDKKKLGLSSDFNYLNANQQSTSNNGNKSENKKITQFMKKKGQDSDQQVFKWKSKNKKWVEPKEKEFTKPDQLLSLSLQQQFEKVKINLPNPDKLEPHREEKFIREKSEIAKAAGDLTKEIKHEKINDKNKLASSIFQDIEKQESWQSYTTLLFADAQVNMQENNKSSPYKPTLTTKGNSLK